MREFDIVYRNIRIRITCNEIIENQLREHFGNHVNFEEPVGDSTYKLVISDSEKIMPNAKHYKMIDKWFEYASLDCYIDDNNKICYINNFNAKNQKYEQLIIQYFVANFFNRFLELSGYLGFHSSCVEKENNGVAFIAERNNGKTICMLNLMNNGYNIVTNDVIAMKKEKDIIMGYGIAQAVSIRLGPVFCAQKENQKYVDLAMKKGINIKYKDMVEGNNLLIADKELAEINNVSQSIDTPISCIIRPCYDPYISNATFEPLDNDQLRELLYSQYRSLVHETTDFLINLKLNGIDESIRYKYFDELMKIPAFYCHQNEKTTKEFVEEIDNIRKKVLKM